MRRLRELNRYRAKQLEQAARERMVGDYDDDQDFGGIFMVPSPIHKGVDLRCIAANDAGWDHVSISPSLPRTPTWSEMEYIKRLFFKPDETAMQLHVTPADHISIHPYVLHLWRPHDVLIPLPPALFV